MERLTDGLNLPGSDPQTDRDRARDHPGRTRPAPPRSRRRQGLKAAMALLLCAGCIGLLVLRVSSLAGETEGVGPVDGTGAASTATGPASNPASNPNSNPESNPAGGQSSTLPPTGPAPSRPPAGAPSDPAAAPNQPRPVDIGPYPGRPERSTPTHINPLPGG